MENELLGWDDGEQDELPMLGKAARVGRDRVPCRVQERVTSRSRLSIRAQA